MPNRENVFGTICSNCNSYIEPDKKPKLIADAEMRLADQQNTIRKYLRRIILGDKHGD